METSECNGQRLAFWDRWFEYLGKRLEPVCSAGDALGDLPNVDNYEELKESDVLHTRLLSEEPGELAAILRLSLSSENVRVIVQ